VQRFQERKAATALDTIEHVLGSLARIRERDHALDTLVVAIEADRDRLRARLAQKRKTG